MKSLAIKPVLPTAEEDAGTDYLTRADRPQLQAIYRTEMNQWHKGKYNHKKNRYSMHRDFKGE